VRSLRDLSYRTVLFDSDDSVAMEADELERLLQQGLDGALVMPVELADNVPVFRQFMRLGFPLVFLDRKPLDLEEVDYVGSDHFWGAYEATKRLIKRGHTRIAHFTSYAPRQSTSLMERRLGYEQALKDHAIDLDPELVCPPALFTGNQFQYKHILSYLRQGERPVTAVFALNDLFLFGTIQACRDLGLRIPEDLEIATFFDCGLDSATLVPIIKVVQRQEEIGRRAVDLLMSRIEGNGPEGPQTLAVKPEIMDY
jgi:DNA-binding LacI/PurR family transcriptional regulator